MCPLYLLKSKIRQHRALPKSGGKECLPQALPQGQTPGKNSWDYSVLSKMDLEPPWLMRDVALDWGCQDWSVARLTTFAPGVHQCDLPFILLLSSLSIEILQNLLPTQSSPEPTPSPPHPCSELSHYPLWTLGNARKRSWELGVGGEL